MSATTALVIGIYGTYKVDQLLFDTDRYPVGAEYEFIDACVNGHGRPRPAVLVTEMKKVCACALEKVMKDISYLDIEESETKFVSRFREKVSECR